MVSSRSKPATAPLRVSGYGHGREGLRVKYALATRLVNELVEAADEKVLAKTIAGYGRVDVLCIDEAALYGTGTAVAPNFSSRS